MTPEQEQKVKDLEQKYMKEDFTGSVRMLRDSVAVIEKHMEDPSYRGQTVDQYLEEVKNCCEKWL